MPPCYSAPAQQALAERNLLCSRHEQRSAQQRERDDSERAPRGRNQEAVKQKPCQNVRGSGQGF
jgi:hypothetical protein